MPDGVGGGAGLNLLIEGRLGCRFSVLVLGLCLRCFRAGLFFGRTTGTTATAATATATPTLCACAVFLPGILLVVGDGRFRDGTSGDFSGSRLDDETTGAAGRIAVLIAVWVAVWAEAMGRVKARTREKVQGAMRKWASLGGTCQFTPASRWGRTKS